MVGSDGTPDRHSLGVQRARAHMKRMPRSRVFVTICVTISHPRRPIITPGGEGASLLLHAQAMPATRRRHCHPARPRHPWQQIRAPILVRTAVAAYSISSRSPCCPLRHRSHRLSPVSSDPQRLRCEKRPAALTGGGPLCESSGTDPATGCPSRSLSSKASVPQPPPATFDGGMNSSSPFEIVVGEMFASDVLPAW